MGVRWVTKGCPKNEEREGRDFNSISSLHFLHSYVGRKRFKNRVIAFLIFHRRQCYGSKKWRWPIHWTNQNPRQQLLERIFKTPRCWTRRMLLLWMRSSRVLTPRRRSVSRNRKPRKRTRFFKQDRSPS